MKIAFLTNFLTHHQTPFCNAMYSKLGEDFHLIVTRPTASEQKKLGYNELNDIYPYVIKTYESKDSEEKAFDICECADVVIYGSAPYKYIEKRLNQDKLTFIYTERIFKKGMIYALYPPMIKHMLKRFTSKRKKNQYYLCASAYTAKDINLFTHTPDKFFKWGYFPETRNYDDVDKIIESKEPNSIIWVARYIDWKHPEIAVEIGNRLKRDGYNFKINMIGNGPLLEEIKNKIAEKNLNDQINVLGGIPSDEVRSHMEKSEIHIFTSDRNEGWGAVLNESMNSACAVVANKAIGSVPFLIENNKNGLVYKDGNIDDLYNKVKWLLDNSTERKNLSRNAYSTIVEEWNALKAVDKFIYTSENLLYNTTQPTLFCDYGICSNAESRRFK